MSISKLYVHAFSCSHHRNLAFPSLEYKSPSKQSRCRCQEGSNARRGYRPQQSQSNKSHPSRTHSHIHPRPQNCIVGRKRRSKQARKLQSKNRNFNIPICTAALFKPPPSKLPSSQAKTKNHHPQYAQLHRSTRL